VVIPNGVVLPSAVKRTHSNGKLRILYLGRLHPIKGIEALLEACTILAKLKPDWHLYIAGTGSASYLAFLKSKVLELSLSEQVEFVGEVSDEKKEELFAQCDVVVVPSYVENFAIVVAESLAHAVPVIASKGTPWNGLETNRCGLWVDNDPQSLAIAIRTVCSLPLQEMGLRGRDWMEKDFSWDSVSSKMLALYCECIQSHKPKADTL
jgi:glycosyltransferase involved in cell wall biosynthesis